MRLEKTEVIVPCAGILLIFVCVTACLIDHPESLTCVGELA